MRIAISGLSGCGNTTACKNVGRSLGLKVINYTFRDLARDLGVPFETVLRSAKTDARFDYLLDQHLQQLAAEEKNCVVGTRLAAWLVDADLSVWLHAPPEARARRIAQREGKPFTAVFKQTRERDRTDIARYKKRYAIDVMNHDDLDVTVNTARLSPEQVSSLIAAAAQWAKKNKARAPNAWSARIKKTLAAKLHGLTLQQLKKTLEKQKR